MSTPHRIFLSYRRGDTAGHVGRLYDELVRYFGRSRVFMDIDGIAPGQDFVSVLDTHLREAAVVLVVMGPRWAGTDEQGGRRIDREGDFVRMEVAASLARPEVTVVPVLCDGATMPAETHLPAAIAPLARRNAIVLSDLRWKHDVQQLITAIEPRVPLDVGGEASGLPRLLARVPRAGWIAAAAVVLLLLWRPWAPAVGTLSGVPTAGEIPKPTDRTPPGRVLRDAKRQLEKARDDWADDAVLVYLGVSCQGAWQGCLTILTFRSEKVSATLTATRSGGDKDWTFQPGQYNAGFREVAIDGIDLEAALTLAREAGMVGPIEQADLEGARPESGLVDARWSIRPVDTDRSGRYRFCVNARTRAVEGC